MAKRKVSQAEEAYCHRGAKSGKDFSNVGKLSAYSLGDMSRGNDGTSTPWTAPASGKRKPGETAGKTKKTNPDLVTEAAQTSNSDLDEVVPPVPMA